MRRFGVQVGLAIARKASGEIALHRGELSCNFDMGPQIVAEHNVVAPQRTAFFYQVHVVRARLTAAEELSARYSAFAAVLVPRAL